MVEWCIGKVQSITKDVEVAQANYTDAVTKIMSADTPVAELEHDVHTLDAAHLQLQNAHNAWKKDAVAEVAKLCG